MSKHYTKEHEWITVDGDIATIGITNHAQEQLGDVVFVELPAIGKKVSKGGDAAVVESVKAASEVYAPISGEVVAVNKELEGDPALACPEVEYLVRFIRTAPRGVIIRRGKVSDEEAVDG